MPLTTIGSLAQSALGIYGAKKQNEENRENATIAFERQRQLIKEANIYNAPKNQLQRLQEAGLNPHLIYGNGAGNMVSATAGTPPAPHAENVMKDINIYTTLKQMKLAERQMKVQERQASVAEKEAETKQYDSETKRIEAGIKERAENRQDDETGFRILTMQEQIYNLQQEREFRNQLHEYDRVSRQLENDINTLTRDQKADLYPFIRLNQMLQNQDILSNISLRRIQEALIDAQTGETESRTKLNNYENEFLDHIKESRKAVYDYDNAYKTSIQQVPYLRKIIPIYKGVMNEIIPWEALKIGAPVAAKLL